MCAAEFVCALDVFARHTSSGITFLALTIVGIAPKVFRTAKLSESNASDPMNKLQKNA
jgi:hypothetical protein